MQVDPANPSTMSSSATDMQLVITDAINMASTMPMPVLDGMDVPEQFKTALMASFKQQNVGNAMLVAGIRRSFCQALDMVTQQASEQIQASKEEIKEEIATTTNRLSSQLRTEFKFAQDAVGAELSDLRRRLDENNPERQILRDTSNVFVRHFLGMVLLGPDTKCEMGMAPIFDFVLHPGQPLNEENIMVVVPKAMFRVMVAHQKAFTPDVPSGMQSRLEKLFVPIFKCRTGINNHQQKIYGCMFPPDLYASNGVYFFPLKHLIKLLQVEMNFYVKDQQGVLPQGYFIRQAPDQPFNKLYMESHVLSSGKLKITDGIPPSSRSSVTRRFRKFTPVTLEALSKLVKNVINKDEDPLSILKRRNYWGQEASKEKLMDPAFQLGVRMINRDVYGRVVDPTLNVFHVGLNWEVDSDTPVKTWAELMSPVLQLTPEGVISAFDKHLKDTEAMYEDNTYVKEEVDEEEEEEEDSEVKQAPLVPDLDPLPFIQDLPPLQDMSEVMGMNNSDMGHDKPTLEDQPVKKRRVTSRRKHKTSFQV